MKKGFTLLEVCLAVTVMATGILSVVILYSMGFRETRQSREDVASAAYADAVLSQLVSALSATNVTWQTFNSLVSYPNDNGWAAYYDSDGQIVSGIDSKAQGAYSAVMGKMPGDVQKAYPSAASAGLKAGLIIMRDDESAVVRIGFRATRNPSMLMAAPLYYTEVRFQGVQE